MVELVAKCPMSIRVFSSGALKKQMSGVDLHAACQLVD